MPRGMTQAFPTGYPQEPATPEESDQMGRSPEIQPPQVYLTGNVERDVEAHRQRSDDAAAQDWWGKLKESVGKSAESLVKTSEDVKSVATSPEVGDAMVGMATGTGPGGAAEGAFAGVAKGAIKSGVQAITGAVKKAFGGKEAPPAPNVEPGGSQGAKKAAPATFLGKQQDGEGGHLDLYNLTEEIPGHPKGSTVSSQTLEKAGFGVPEPPAVPPAGTPGHESAITSVALKIQSEEGGISPQQAGLLARMAVGAIAGSAVGDEEHTLKNAMIGAGIGALASPALMGKLIRAAKSGAAAPEKGAATSADTFKLQMSERLKEQQVGNVKGTEITTRPHEQVAQEVAFKAAQGKATPAEEYRLLYKNTPLSDSQLTEFRNMLDPEMEKLTTLARSGNHEEFLKQWQFLTEDIPSFLGAETASARGTAMANDPTKPVAETARQIASLALDPAVQDTHALMAQVAQLKTTDELATAIAQAGKPGWKNAFHYVFINSLLSPASDFINFVATGGNVLWSIPERAAAGQVGKAFNKAGVVPGEASEMTAALFNNVGDAWKVAAKSFREDAPVIGKTKRIEVEHTPTAAELLPPGIKNLDRYGVVGRGFDYLIAASGLTGRFMMGGDQFMEALSAQMEAAARTYRFGSKALANGTMTREEFDLALKTQHARSYFEMPPELKKPADQFALYTTLNQDLGPFGKQLMGARDKMNDMTLGVGGTIVQSFFRTLANGVKYTGERTPLALGSRNVWADLKSGDPVKRDMALGKWALGTMTLGALTQYAYNGGITGSLSSDPGLRKLQDAAGMRPYSVYLPGVGYREVDRTGNVGHIIGMAGDLGDAWHLMNDGQREEAAMHVTRGTLAALDFGFIRGTAALFTYLASAGKQATADVLPILDAMVPGGSLIRTSEKIPGSPTYNPYKPDVTNTVGSEAERTESMRKHIDPAVDEAEISFKKVLAQLPGYGDLAKQFGLPEVYAERNWRGEKVMRPKSDFGTESFNPMYVMHTRKDADPATLRMVDLNLSLEKPKAVIQGVPLTAKEYDAYTERAGALASQRVDQLIKTPLFQNPNTSPVLQGRLLLSTVQKAREDAGKMMLADRKTYPELSMAYAQKQRMAGAMMSPNPPAAPQRPAISAGVP